MPPRYECRPEAPLILHTQDASIPLLSMWGIEGAVLNFSLNRPNNETVQYTNSNS